MNTFSTYYTSPLGPLKLECTDAFLQTLIFWGDKPQTETSSHSILTACVQQLDNYFNGGTKTFNLPLQQNGTAFQQKVWSLLNQIPYGKTISYNELSKQYGDLKAIRAVAAANGRNNLAIIIPCHRVIGSNQSLTGYAGGLWRKKWLLEHEAKFNGGVQQLGLEI